MERCRSAGQACLQRAEISERSSESPRYRERSQASRSKDQYPPKRFRGEFIGLDEYSSSSDTSLATSSGSGSSLASSSENGSDTSLSEISSSRSTILYSTGSESSLDESSDCSVATPAVEAVGHELKETPELWGTYDDMERQLESWASEKPGDFVPVTPKLRENSDKGLGQVTLSLIKKPQTVSMVRAERLSTPGSGLSQTKGQR